MTTNEIRTLFLNFFKSKEHKIVASDSVVPKDDPTVLFTTAGMQQFKRQFLGNLTGFDKAATSQKCMRTDDLDEVGETDFHHTFFEMLGNFSFGAYFKKEAITWAWEFLTQELNMPEDKLWVSVYKDDDEAYNIWADNIKLDKKKIVKLGDKSNFWPSNAKENGPNGPCGPCSEIFYDFGKNPKCKSKVCDPDCDCGRFSEVWNLVFTQFERKEGGMLEPLPNKNIDTGMGLERLAAVVQGKKNNFEIDLFAPIIEGIEKNIESKDVQLSLKEKRIIADHIRAVVIAINDGVIPSNEGRGYVIKKLIVDSTDLILQAGQTKASLYKLTESVIEAMEVGYPELKGKEKEISAIIKSTESAFIKVRTERIPELSKKIKAIIKKDEDLPTNIGEQMFIFRDTYGLTYSTIESILKELGIKPKMLNESNKHYEQLMDIQKEQSRATSKMTGDVFTGTNIDLSKVKSEFVGYTDTQCSGKILKILIEDNEQTSANQNDKGILITDKTPFYAESGGQIGDTGTIQTESGEFTVEHTQKIDNVHIHIGFVSKGSINSKDKANLEINEERRLSIMRNHTATHILQSALREVLGDTVKQQGSLVAEDRLRFDFTYHKALTKDEINKIERIVNANILKANDVEKQVLPIEKAKKLGALSFFAEKYGDIVRVVSIDDYSKEFCGGTHLDSTGQIGLFRITQESAVAQGIRRIEAKTGSFALDFVYQQESELNNAAKLLKSSPNELVTRLKAQTNRLKALEKECEELTFNNIKGSIDSVIDKSEKINDTVLFCQTYKNIDNKTLRKISDFVKQKTNSAIIVLGATTDENGSILVSASQQAIKQGFKANDIVNRIAPLIDGTGGGRPELAQAGSKSPQKVESAIKQVKKIITEQ